MQLPHSSLGVLSVAFLALGLGSCAGEARAKDDAPRLVVLYAPCSVNAQFLSPYDEDVAWTPHLDEFAAESVVFERHQTESGQSGIAYASILTGSQCDSHGIYRHPAILPGQATTITEAFAAAGYEPFFWGAHHMAWGDLEYAQGVPDENVFTTYKVHGDPIFTRILERVRDEADYRAFVVVHFSEVTHSPYRGHRLEPFLEKFPELRGGLTDDEIERYGELYKRRHHNLAFNFPETVEKLGLSDEQIDLLARVTELRYKSTIHDLDALFGSMLDRVRDHDLMGESVIAFTADHGEVFYRDNALYQWAHGYQLAPEVLHVPWLLRLPDGRAARYEGVTRSMDVFPTLFGLVGRSTEADDRVRGRDLSRAARGDEPAPHQLGLSHTTVLVDRVARQIENGFSDWNLLRETFPDDDVERIWVAIRDRDLFFQLRSLDGEQFVVRAYDLAVDPEIRNDLFDANDPAHAAMAERLHEYKQDLVVEFRRRASTAEATHQLTDEEELQLLRDLGYVR